MRKRAFDVLLTLAASVVLLPVLAVSCLAILVFSGRPVFYVSKRRVDQQRIISMAKLRTMVRNADKIANRDTVPVAVSGTRFLNISADSPLYTRVGRIVEKCQFTELPQVFLVLSGKLSIVGSRPLPENVVNSLREEHDNVDDRFATRAGLTGPVQLVGRENLSDADRLRLEGYYCRVARDSYAVRMDLKILLHTVLTAARLSKGKTVAEVEMLLRRYDRFAPAQASAEALVPEQASHGRVLEEARHLIEPLRSAVNSTVSD